MKSKTSCFNRTIFKKNVTQYWPLWSAYLLYLLIIVPINIWQHATDEWYMTRYGESERMYVIIVRAVANLIRPEMTFLFAALAAMAVFSYLYTAKNANMMHALPVNRFELFVTNYVSGLSFLLVPQMIVFFISVLVCLANQITLIQYLLFGMLIQMGIAFFAYSLAVFVAMFTGQLLAVPAYYLVINYLYVGCSYIVSLVANLLTYGVTNIWNPGKECILSPVYYLGNNLKVEVTYGTGVSVNEPTGIAFSGVNLVRIYAVVAVFLAVAAYQTYRRRQIETAGDWISVGFLKPVFRWGVAFCGGALLSVLITGELVSAHRMNVYLCSVVCLIVAGFLCFFAAEMLLKKQFKVFQKKRILEWAGFSVVAVLFLTLFEVDAFGIERKVPKADEIEAVFINMDYPMLVDEAAVEEMLEIHKDVIAHKEEYQKLAQGNEGYYYTTFRYYLKDGSTFERRYPIAITEEYLADATSPASRILAWESEPENLKRNLLGMNYERNEYISGCIDLYDEDNISTNRLLTREELKVLTAAIEQDVEEGNFDDYCSSCVGAERIEFYCTNISIDYYNSSKCNDVWDYYSDYSYYNGDTLTKESASASTGYSYISFGPECVNTVDALENLGIVDDTWKLCTIQEYQARAAK